jgi:hypothetical protein
MYAQELSAALGWMYEDDEHGIYSDEFCRLQREAALENFDSHKSFFRHLCSNDCLDGPEQASCGFVCLSAEARIRLAGQSRDWICLANLLSWLRLDDLPLFQRELAIPYASNCQALYTPNGQKALDLRKHCARGGTRTAFAAL